MEKGKYHNPKIIKKKDYWGNNINYGIGKYNMWDNKEQWIRLTEGCPHNCEFCHESTKFKIYTIPQIMRNKVKIMDMNILAKPKAFDIIDDLPEYVDSKVVYYEFICGIDYRFLTQEIADLLKEKRFKNLRIAWDWNFSDQFELMKKLKMLLKAGYKPKQLMIFMICNWKISYKENCKKLELLKVWNMKVADCWYDGQYGRTKIPIFWTADEIKAFRRKCRKHNQLISWGYDPEVK